ncbi:hypothetical protein H257_11382 [Aphanomyces astaci]|uniref:Uncharacterized protein n=1 Tax=Aphanomyces astaci TaxID=112090 RepID=W4G493_APHAT|nr:hypothetical protein H257_11382 [Aphanomyces astaci]ETV74071.1 hypothetical protein H257_11382 [Aphanomyces astaci]|eukprot:XP_009836584.1 hypothetical protein H257_11382 [Aphanomyces astaci]
MKTSEVENVDAPEIKTEGPKQSKTEGPQRKKAKKGSPNKKSKSNSESLESGYNAIKEGLMFLGTSMVQQPPAQTAQRATLDYVLDAIKAQSDTMAQLVAIMVAHTKKQQ